MTDWAQIRHSICEGRQFTIDEGGASVLSDTMMPSGAVIRIHLHLRHGLVYLHDDSAAFDELARSGKEVSGLGGLRAMLTKTNFKVGDDGAIWRERVEPKNVAVGVALVADASARAGAWLVSNGKFRSGIPLDRRMKDVLRSRFPNGRTDFTFQGANRQHKFDFGIQEQDRTVLLEAVTPEPSSVNSAIVKALDASKVEKTNVVPLLVFDPKDDWQGALLSMLKLGGRGVEFDALKSGALPIAA